MKKQQRSAAFAIAIVAAALTFSSAPYAAELDPKVISVLPPDAFKWRDPTDQIITNQTVLHGEPRGPGLYVMINKFKPDRFGAPHYHSLERYITVIQGAAWAGTGPGLDPA